jgi:hypothetical protein
MRMVHILINCIADGPRPNHDEIIELRFLMLQYVRQLLLRGSGVQDDELQSIMNFLITVNEVSCRHFSSFNNTVCELTLIIIVPCVGCVFEDNFSRSCQESF